MSFLLERTYMCSDLLSFQCHIFKKTGMEALFLYQMYCEFKTRQIRDPQKKKLASLVVHLNSQSPEDSSYFPFHIPLFVGSFHDSSEKMTFQAVSQTFSQKLSQSLLHSLHIYSHCIKIKQETNIYKAQYTVFLYAHS